MEIQFLAAILGAITAIISTAVKALKFVQEGEQGCKLRFGKVMRYLDGKPIIFDPGFALLIPWVDTLKRRHVRQQTMRFERQEIFIKEDLVFIVSAIVRFRVRDIYKALFEVDELDSCINDRCMGLLRDVLQGKNHTEIRDTESIATELLTTMKTMESEWGVEFLDTRLTSCAPSDNSASILSSMTSARIRAEAALEAAKKLGGSPHELQGLLSAIIGTPVSTNAGLQVSMTGKLPAANHAPNNGDLHEAQMSDSSVGS